MDLADIEELTVKQKQQQDAKKNKEFDKDMDAYRRGKNLTDEQRKKVLQDNARKRQLLGSKIIDNIEGKIGEAGSAIMEAAQDDPDTWTDDAIRIGLGGLKNVGTVLSAPGIKQGLQLVGAPAYYVGRGLGYGLERAGVDPRYGHILGEVGEWFIPGYGMYRAAGKIVKGTTGTIKKVQAISQADEFMKARKMQLAVDLQMNIKKGDGYSYRKGRPLKNPIWDNLPEKTQKQFIDAGIDSDKAKFFIENWTREVGATVEGFPFTDRTFEFMKGELLPQILEDLKGIDLSDGLQLDHIAQLRAMTPFYKGRNLKQAEKIRRILIKEGVFGGHNPKNLKYLPTDVHTVKTKFWEQQVGKDGSKFFKDRPMRTYADIEKAAKEMKNFINRSNDIVEKVSAQYKFMRKKNITADELDKILKKVDLNYGTYNLKEVRALIKEIEADKLAKSKKGLDDAKKAAEAIEFKEKKTFLPYEIEDLDPADIPKKPRTKKKKSTLEKMAEKEFLKEHERIKKLGGQTELPLDE